LRAIWWGNSVTGANSGPNFKPQRLPKKSRISKWVLLVDIEDKGEQDNKELLSECKFLEELSALEKLVTF
jgi:hypothetical protein